MHIEGFYLNADDFKIEDKSILKQELRGVNTKLPKSDFIAMVVISKHLEEFEFSYFNLQKNDFDSKKIKIEFENDSTSTNTTVNPKLRNSYRLYILIVLTSIFFGLYYFRRKYIYIIIFSIIFAYLIYDIFLSRDSGVIAKDSKVRILATKNSRISKTTAKQTTVTILTQQNGYYNILFEDDSTGWTKVENIVKN
jgi:hypothetical protein